MEMDTEQLMNEQTIKKINLICIQRWAWSTSIYISYSFLMENLSLSYGWFLHKQFWRHWTPCVKPAIHEVVTYLYMFDWK